MATAAFRGKYEPTLEERGAFQILNAASEYLKSHEKKLKADPHDRLAAADVEASYFLFWKALRFLDGSDVG